MSYSLHYAQHYEPGWKGGSFNHDSDAFENLYYAEFVDADDSWKHNNEDMYEIGRDTIQAYIDKIKDNPKDNNEYFTEYTNEEVVDNLEEILNSDDDIIRIEWY